MVVIHKDQLREFDKKYKCDEWGKHSRYFCTKESVESLGLKYREGRGIKLVVNNKMKTTEHLQRLALIQTYYHYRGLSPKVYNTGWVGEYPYLEVEHIEGKFIKPTKKLIDKIEKVASDSGFIKPYLDLNIEKNYIQREKIYYIDFHGFEINLEYLERKLMKDINDKTHWGKNNNEGDRYSYQGWLTLGLTGKRNCDDRINQMNLKSIDFKDKTVLDIGCNLGLMSHYATTRGAKVIAVDKINIIESAEMFKYLKGLSNVEFYADEFTPDTIDKYGEFDIVFYFAMIHSLGRPKKLKDITKEILIYEGHNLENTITTYFELKEIFNSVEYAGHTIDRGIRPVFWCKH